MVTISNHMNYEEIVVSNSEDVNNPQLIKDQSPDQYNELAYTEESVDDIGTPKSEVEANRCSLTVSEEKREPKNIDLLSPNI